MASNGSESFVQDLGNGTGRLIMQGKGGKPGAKEGISTPLDGSVEVRKAQSDINRSVNVELSMSIDPIHKGILIIEGPVGTIGQIEKRVRLLPLAEFVSCLTEARLKEILTGFPPEKEVILRGEVLNGNDDFLGAETQPTVILYPVDDVIDEIRQDTELDLATDNTSEEFHPDKEIIIVDEDEDLELVA